MRLLRRHEKPRAKTFRPAERYLGAAGEEARRLGHNYVGTEHLLLALTRDAEGAATRVLHRLGATRREIEDRLAPFTGTCARRIDPEALATLGIDFEVVRERLEEIFGAGALERTHPGCLSVAPRLKMVLAYAVDRAGDQPVQDEHVLLAMLSVRDSLAARVLAELGVTLEAAEAIVREQPP